MEEAEYTRIRDHINAEMERDIDASIGQIRRKIGCELGTMLEVMAEMKERNDFYKGDMEERIERAQEQG